MVSPELLADVTAVVAELVGNAIRHARPLPGGVIYIACRLGAGNGRHFLQVKVTDGGGDPELPRQRAADLDAVDGRGLAIVAALSSEWGVDRDSLGQSVWARLSIPRQAAASDDPAHRTGSASGASHAAGALW